MGGEEEPEEEEDEEELRGEEELEPSAWTGGDVSVWRFCTTLWRCGEGERLPLLPVLARSSLRAKSSCNSRGGEGTEGVNVLRDRVCRVSIDFT
jgi:hypothetical protein